jgi:hypothetical protein
LKVSTASDFAWGTASAKTITISFWVRSSLTGTFGSVLSNGAVNYSYPFTYAISAANTWEYKTVTIAGPTAGTWVTNNGAGPVLQFVIGTGSTYQGSAGSWSANGYYGVTGTVDVTGTNGATLYITGVQLEVGSTATDFENLPYDVELARCQRYYQVGDVHLFAGGGSSGDGTVLLPVQMRANPTVTFSDSAGTANTYTDSAGNGQSFSINANSANTYRGSRIMASIKLKGDTSGEVTISAPSVAGTTTLTLPATSSTLATQNSLGVRNLIINGDMRIAQRGTSVTNVTGGNYNTVDRWQWMEQSTATLDMEQSTDVPTGQGFVNSVKLTVNRITHFTDSLLKDTMLHI